ncbi:hypothetical protein Ddye_023612 [Dipteronia dyeriana]|uniref:Transmembrane protein n=1 Tax=Dipteronia dyeriana TaxID=168575 RepID=A0AAD9WS88_9ROSI|nr:hypothetical protein Ddye_023612 [Dipteronia dyeriana]
MEVELLRQTYIITIVHFLYNQFGLNCPFIFLQMLTASYILWKLLVQCRFCSIIEVERSELIDGEESSECLQFEDSIEKTCSRVDDVESNEELSKKRRNIEIEDQNGCGKPDARILRSTKHFAGKVLPRRSMRLVSK